MAEEPVDISDDMVVVRNKKTGKRQLVPRSWMQAAAPAPTPSPVAPPPPAPPTPLEARIARRPTLANKAKNAVKAGAETASEVMGAGTYPTRLLAKGVRAAEGIPEPPDRPMDDIPEAEGLGPQFADAAFPRGGSVSPVSSRRPVGEQVREQFGERLFDALTGNDLLRQVPPAQGFVRGVSSGVANMAGDPLFAVGGAGGKAGHYVMQGLGIQGVYEGGKRYMEEGKKHGYLSSEALEGAGETAIGGALLATGLRGKGKGAEKGKPSGDVKVGAPPPAPPKPRTPPTEAAGKPQGEAKPVGEAAPAAPAVAPKPQPKPVTPATEATPQRYSVPIVDKRTGKATTAEAMAATPEEARRKVERQSPNYRVSGAPIPKGQPAAPVEGGGETPTHEYAVAKTGERTWQVQHEGPPAPEGAKARELADRAETERAADSLDTQRERGGAPSVLRPSTHRYNDPTAGPTEVIDHGPLADKYYDSNGEPVEVAPEELSNPQTLQGLLRGEDGKLVRAHKLERSGPTQGKWGDEPIIEGRSDYLEPFQGEPDVRSSMAGADERASSRVRKPVEELKAKSRKAYEQGSAAPVVEGEAPPAPEEGGAAPVYDPSKLPPVARQATARLEGARPGYFDSTTVNEKGVEVPVHVRSIDRQSGTAVVEFSGEIEPGHAGEETASQLRSKDNTQQKARGWQPETVQTPTGEVMRGAQRPSRGRGEQGITPYSTTGKEHLPAGLPIHGEVARTSATGSDFPKGRTPNLTGKLTVVPLSKLNKLGSEAQRMMKGEPLEQTAPLLKSERPSGNQPTIPGAGRTMAPEPLPGTKAVRDITSREQYMNEPEPGAEPVQPQRDIAGPPGKQPAPKVGQRVTLTNAKGSTFDVQVTGVKGGKVTYDWTKQGTPMNTGSDSMPLAKWVERTKGQGEGAGAPPPEAPTPDVTEGAPPPKGEAPGEGAQYATSKKPATHEGEGGLDLDTIQQHFAADAMAGGLSHTPRVVEPHESGDPNRAHIRIVDRQGKQLHSYEITLNQDLDRIEINPEDLQKGHPGAEAGDVRGVTITTPKRGSRPNVGVILTGDADMPIVHHEGVHVLEKLAHLSEPEMDLIRERYGPKGAEAEGLSAEQVDAQAREKFADAVGEWNWAKEPVGPMQKIMAKVYKIFAGVRDAAWPTKGRRQEVAINRLIADIRSGRYYVEAGTPGARFIKGLFLNQTVRQKLEALNHGGKYLERDPETGALVANVVLKGEGSYGRMAKMLSDAQQAVRDGDMTREEYATFSRQLKSGGHAQITVSGAKLKAIQNMIDPETAEWAHQVVDKDMRLETLDRDQLHRAIDEMLTPGMRPLEPYRAAMLRKVMPKAMQRRIQLAIEANQEITAKHRILHALGFANEFSKAVKASWDLSFPLRQGLVQVAGHPIDSFSMVKPMLKAFAHPEQVAEMADVIKDHEHYPLMKQMGVKLSITEHGYEGGSAEQFQGGGAEFAREVVPLVGRSDAAFAAAGDFTRFAAAKRMIAGLTEAGIDPSSAEGMKIFEKAGDYINNSTGLGELRMPETLEAEAPGLAEKMRGLEGDANRLLRHIWWSPSFVWSRLALMNPLNLTTLGRFGERGKGMMAPENFTLREHQANVAKLMGGVAAVLGLYNYAQRQEGNKDAVELNMTSSDFLKMQIGTGTGNKRWRADILGGFQQYAKIAAQIATGQIKTGKGDIKRLGDYGAPNVVQVLATVFANKTTPIVRALLEGWEGKDPTGAVTRFDFSSGKQVEMALRHHFINAISPMSPSDMADIAKSLDKKELTPVQGVVLGVLSQLGAGVYRKGDAHDKKYWDNTLPWEKPVPRPADKKPSKAKSWLEAPNRWLHGAMKPGEPPPAPPASED